MSSKIIIKNRIKAAEKRIAAIFDELQAIRSMVRGTYGANYRRCGKSNCWCSTSSTGHLMHRITWFKDAKAGTKAIPKKDIHWIKEMTGNYRQFRQLRAELRTKVKELQAMLDLLEDDIILKTMSKRDYLKNIPQGRK